MSIDMVLTVESTDFNDWVRSVDIASRFVEKATEEFLGRELRVVLDRAIALAPLGVDVPWKIPFPHKAGTLKESGYIEGPTVAGQEIAASIGFGGDASPYAWIQHETLFFRHPRGGQAKYLEQPLAEWTNEAMYDLSLVWQELFS